MRHTIMVVAGHRIILTYAVAKLTFPILDATTQPALWLTMHIKSSMKRHTVGYVLEVFDTLAFLGSNTNEFVMPNKIDF